MEERRFEFAFEGINYWDLLRQGIEYAANKLAVQNVPVLTAGAPAEVTINAQDIIDKKGLSMISETQITLSNGVLKQNPGWD